MEDNRSILFYILGADKSTHPYTFDRADLGKSLLAIFKKFAIAMSVTCPGAVPKTDADLSKEFSFFDWDLQSLLADITIAQIPNPGIVIAINKCNVEMETMAAAVKLQVENTQNPIQKDLLNQFLSGAKGNIDSSSLTDHIVSSVEVKPKFLGIEFDLKKLFRRKGKP